MISTVIVLRQDHQDAHHNTRIAPGAPGTDSHGMVQNPKASHRILVANAKEQEVT